MKPARRSSARLLLVALLAMLALVVGASRTLRAQAPGPRASAPPSAAVAPPSPAAASISAAPSASASTAPAKEEVKEQKPWVGPPDDVHVGVYVNQVTELSLKENHFTVDFWVWFRWKSDDIKPYQTFEIANGQIGNKGDAEVSKVKGMNYAVLRVVATVTVFWDVSRYPLDDHTMTLVIEDSESEAFKLRYLPDVESSGVDGDFQVPGWTLARTAAEVTTTAKHSNYGDISLPADKESTYSSFAFSMKLERHGSQYFLKLFFGLFIAAMIAFLVFYIRPTDVDPRFGLGVGAIFAAVASEYIVTSALPDTNVISLADKLHIVAFGFIFLSLVQSTWSLRVLQADREAESKRMDRIAAVVFPIAYLVASVLTVVLR